MTKNRIIWLTLSIAAAAGVFAAIQAYSPYIIGADGHLHARMAGEVARNGFIRSYPDAALSLFSGDFSDKDFIYHLYLIPFMTLFGDPAGVKIASLSAAVLLVAAVLYAIRSLPVILIPVATALMLLSPQFLRDMSEARPFTLAVALTVIAADFYINRKYRWVFMVLLIYGMFHLSAWAFLVFACIHSLIKYVAGSGNARGLMAATGGFIVSFFIHPNFPVNIRYWLLNGIMVPWYVLAGNVLEVGAEFFPLTTREAILRYPMIVFAVAAIITALALGNRLSRSPAFSWMVVYFAYGSLGLVSTRNMTHAYPLAVISTVFLLRDLYCQIIKLHPVKRDRILSAVGLFIIITGITGSIITFRTVRNMILSDRIFADHYSRVADFIGVNIPAGSRIFHTNWSDSQYLLGMAPGYEYLVTLDPVYMYAYDPEIYRLYRRISHATEADAAVKIKNSFGATFGYTNKIIFAPFYTLISNSPDFSVLAEDDIGAVFRVK